MLSILTQECDFEIANLPFDYKKGTQLWIYAACSTAVWNPSLFIFEVINLYTGISFIEIKTLIKNLVSLDGQ